MYFCNINKLFLLTALFLLPTALCAMTDEELALSYKEMAEAAREGDIDRVKHYLTRKINPNGYNFKETPTELTYFASLRTPPIQEAAQKGYFDIVKLLIENGADPNWCCCSCVTALELAIEAGHEKIANYLIHNGADYRDIVETQHGEITCLEAAKQHQLQSTVKLIQQKLTSDKEERECEQKHSNALHSYLRNKNVSEATIKEIHNCHKLQKKLAKSVFRLALKKNEQEYIRFDDIILLLNSDNLRILRNTFHAAKGYKFKDPELQRYFSKFSWYEPKAHDKPISFTPLQKGRIQKILNREKYLLSEKQ